jgi:hypothetical protein
MSSSNRFGLRHERCEVRGIGGSSVAFPARCTPRHQSDHAARREEASHLRHPDAPWAQDRTYVPNADQRLPARQLLLLLPDLWVGRAVGEEHPRHRVLLDRDTRSGRRARRAGADNRSRAPPRAASRPLRRAADRRCHAVHSDARFLIDLTHHRGAFPSRNFHKHQGASTGETVLRITQWFFPLDR